MRPRIGSGLVAVALITAAAVGVTGAPALAQVAPAGNPEIELGSCGPDLDIALVLDRHARRNTPAWLTAAEMRDQAKAVVASLVGSGSSVSITSFADTAAVEAPATLVDGSGNATLQAALDAIPLVDDIPPLDPGMSNWEDALLEAQTTFAGFSGGRPDVLIMISDTPADIDNGAGDPVGSARAAADAIKGDGTHVYGVMAFAGAAPFLWILDPPLAPVFGQSEGFLPGADGTFTVASDIAQRIEAGLDFTCNGSRTANPPYTAGCEAIDVAIVVDRSGSIGAANMDSIQAALHDLLDALADNGSRVSLASYSTTATLDADVTPLTTGPDLDSLHAAVDSLSSAGATNWAAGLNVSRSTSAGFSPAGRSDLVLHITDGNPNTPPFPALAIEVAVDEANAMKANGAHMFVVGITDSVGENHIRLVSGPDEFPSTTFAEADYTVVADFAALQGALLGLVDDLCAATGPPPGGPGGPGAPGEPNPGADPGGEPIEARFTG